MIKIERVNHSFQDTQVLKDIDLTIHDNEIFGLVGPSGVGSTAWPGWKNISREVSA